MGQFEDALNEALASAPELQTMPGVASALGQSQNPTNDAQALAQVANLATTNTAYQQVKQRHSWLDSAIGDVGGAVGSAVKAGGKVLGEGLNYANKPLQEVQHEYRYLRDVYKQKGVVPGLAETLGTLVASVGTGILTDSPATGILAGEGALDVMGRGTYSDVWKSSATSGSSPGQDLTRLIGLKHNRWISGTIDGISDLALDPVAQATGGLGDLRAPGEIADYASVGGLDAMRASATKGPLYERALTDLASKTSPEISRDYPAFTGLIADRLGTTSTADEAHQVFRDVVGLRSALDTTPDITINPATKLPSLTLTQQAFIKTKAAALANAPDVVDQYILRPFSKQPAALDQSLKFVTAGDKIAPDDPAATEIVRRMMRIGHTDPVANDFANEFAVASNDRKIELWNSAKVQAVLGRAKADPNLADPNLIRTLTSALSDDTSFGKGVFLTNMDNEDISKVPVNDIGSEKSLGARANQTGKLTIPDFTQLKRASQLVGSYNDIFNKAIDAGTTAEDATAAARAGAKLPTHAVIDDWMASHITQPFKALVTLSPATGERIALSEAIPQALHNGPINTIKAQLAYEYAKLGQKVTDDDVSRIGAFVYKVLPRDLLDNTDAVNAAVAQGVANGGDFIHPTVSAVHERVTEDIPPVESQILNLNKAVKTNPSITRRFGDDFDIFKYTGDQLSTQRWQANLREAANDPATNEAAAAATAVLRGGGTMDDARNAGAMAAGQFIRDNPHIYSTKFGRFENAFVGGDAADHWGRVISEGMFGDVGYKAADGTYGVNRDLLQAIADTPTDAELRDEIATGRFSEHALNSIPTDQTPAVVKGRVEVTPFTQTTFQRIASAGHKKVVEPIINSLARQPIFNAKFADNYHAMQDMVDTGVLSDEQRIMYANDQTARDILPYIHNTKERSQLAFTAQNFMPFYFAQEQAWQRAGRLLLNDPAAFRRYQLMMTGLVNSGSPTSDPGGNGYLALPGTGFITAATTKAASALGVPIAGSISAGLSGRLASLNTVFPFVEDPAPWHKPGPLVSIPLKALSNLRPEIAPITDAVLGPQSTAGSLWDQIIPNQFVKNALQAAGVRGQTTQQYNSTVSIIQELADRGQLPDATDPMAQQTFVDRVKNQSRILDGVKALLSLVSPAAPRVDIRGQFSNLANQYITKYGNVPAAMQHLREDHPDATAETVFKSTTPLGENIPAYKDAQAWIDSNNALVHQFPQAAAFLVPQKQGDAFSQSIYNEQLAQHLRQRKTPTQFLNDVYVASGNALFYGRDLPAHQAAVDQLVAQGDTHGAAAERASFQNYINSDFGPKNPVWWNNYKSPTGTQNKQQAISGLVQIFAKGLAPDTQQSHDVAGLLSDWATHQAALKPGVAANLATADRANENASWDAYLKQLAVEKPNLVPIINALFRDTGEQQIGTVTTG